MSAPLSQSKTAYSNMFYKYTNHLYTDSTGHLYCEEVKVKDLQASLGKHLDMPSPFYLYSKGQIEENVHHYLNALKDGYLPGYLFGYSVKANYNLNLLTIFRDMGCTAVTVSGNEIKLALVAGFNPQNIIFNGNGKQRWELNLAINNGCIVNIDSEFDLENVSQISHELGKKSRIVLRVNPDIEAHVHPFLATGLSASKFGIDESELDNLLDIIKNDGLLQLIGLHCHLGSTIDNTRVFRESAEVMVRLLEKYRQCGHNNLHYLNLGGGLGINYKQHMGRTKSLKQTSDMNVEKNGRSENLMAKVKARFETTNGIYENFKKIWNEYSEEIMELEEFERRVATMFSDSPDVVQEICDLIPQCKIKIPLPTPADLINAVKPILAGHNIHLILEPGRSLIGNTATLITKTLGCKKNGDKRFVIVDGSMNEVIRPSLYSAYHHIELTEPTHSAETRKQQYDIVGPVCECTDFIGKDRLLPVPHVDCGLAVFDVGAYCAAMASNYNMRMRPAEVLVDGKTWSIVRQPDTFDDLIKSFRIPKH